MIAVTATMFTALFLATDGIESGGAFTITRIDSGDPDMREVLPVFLDDSRDARAIAFFTLATAGAYVEAYTVHIHHAYGTVEWSGYIFADGASPDHKQFVYAFAA